MADIKAGAAYVEAYLNTSRLQAGLRSLRGDLGSFSRTVAVGGAGLTAFGAAIALPLNSAVAAAGAAREEFNAFNQVLGQSAAAASAFADQLAKATNRSAQDLRGALSTFQAFFRGAGFDAAPALQLSEALTQLAVDFSSFRNIDQAEAIQRFIAALSGSSEVLDQFGINIKEGAINAELLGRGIKGHGTEAQRTLARVAIIARELGKQGALGDATRTAGSFANTAQGLSAAMRQLQVSIGDALIPLRTEWNQRLTAAVQVVDNFVAQHPQLIVSLSSIATGFTVAGSAAIVLGTGTIVASATLGGLRTLAAAALSPITALGSSFVRLGSIAAATASASVGAAVNATVGLVAGTVAATRSLLVTTLTSAVATVRTIAASIVATLAGVVGSSTTGLVASAAGAAVAALTAVGGAVTGLVAAVGAGLVSLGGFVATFGTIGTVAGTAIYGVGAFVAILGSLPAVAVGGLTALAGVSLGLENVGAAVVVAGQHFVALGGIAVDSFKGIAAALLSGNLQGAMQIAGAGLRAAWHEVLLGLLETTIALFGEENTNAILTALNLVRSVLGGLVSLIGTILAPIKAILSGISSVVAFVVAQIGRLTGTAVEVSGVLDDLRASSADAAADLSGLTTGAAAEGAAIPKLELPALPTPADLAGRLEAGFADLDLPDLTTAAGIDEFRAKTLGFGKEFGADFGAALDQIRRNPTISELERKAAEAGQALGANLGIPPDLFGQVGDLAAGLKDAVTGAVKPGALEGVLPDPLALLAGVVAPGGPGKGKGAEAKTFGTFSAFAASVQGGTTATDHLKRLKETAERHRTTADRQLKELERTNLHLGALAIT